MVLQGLLPATYDPDSYDQSTTAPSSSSAPCALDADVITPFTGAYDVSKAGVSMLSRQLAVEWGPSGVRSNAVLPGLIYTPMVKAMYDRPGVSERRAAAVPLRRVGAPADIAEAVLFLASPRSSYVNGAEILVDGGFTNNVMSLIPRPVPATPN